MSDYNREPEKIQEQGFVKMFGNDLKMKKVDRYGWKPIGQKGAFVEIEKEELDIDLSYQRETTTNSKILRIAREFDWTLFGAISVAETLSGKYFILDGGHRYRAAMLRVDVEKIPCMLHKITSHEEEARIFLNAQITHTTVSPIDRHKAALVARDDLAIESEKLVSHYGYKFIKSSGGEFSTAAINTIYGVIARNKTAAWAAFGILTNIAQGAPIKNEEIKGLFYLIMANPHIDFKTFPMKNLQKAGFETIQRDIVKYKLARGKGGEKVFAEGMLDIINKGKGKDKVIILS